MPKNYRYQINIMFLPAIINLLEPFATLTSWRTKARIKNILFLTTIPSNVTVTAKKKRCFPLRIFSVNVTKPANLVIITEEIFNGKLSFARCYKASPAELET